MDVQRSPTLTFATKKLSTASGPAQGGCISVRGVHSRTHGSGPVLIQVHLCLSNTFRVCEAKSESISPARMCARARARGDDVILGGQRDVTFSMTSAVLTPATVPELDL